jgi:hypothetical protein
MLRDKLFVLSHGIAEVFEGFVGCVMYKWIVI